MSSSTGTPFTSWHAQISLCGSPSENFWSIWKLSSVTPETYWKVALHPPNLNNTTTTANVTRCLSVHKSSEKGSCRNREPHWKEIDHDMCHLYIICIIHRNFHYELLCGQLITPPPQDFYLTGNALSVMTYEPANDRTVLETTVAQPSRFPKDSFPSHGQNVKIQ